MTEPRSHYASKKRRERLDWPADKDFTILSIDGGGIKGIFPAALLSRVEQQLLNGQSVAKYFDMITGTSTGGIIALGLANGLTAAELLAMYMDRGQEIFPLTPDNWVGRMKKKMNTASSQFLYRYDETPLNQILNDVFGYRLLRESQNRLCIPSFEGKHSEVYIFKTPHHPDYKLDAKEKLTTVARATSAAPTFFRSLEADQYTFVDGGVWCNNPVMVGVVDAMACYNIPPERIRVLSIGCGDAPYYVHDATHLSGGKWQWREVIFAAMHLQSQNALGQASLLIGPENMLRVSPPLQDDPIKLDDWLRASTELPAAADTAYQENVEYLQQTFFQVPAEHAVFYN